ncbi:hypothetical protein NL676_037493 [Syzygium grande]|nr:hypothetical protein NL676_037493 [Syzygium grande]
MPSKIALVDGIVMGGGAGLAMHAAFRVVTENTVFAMPEASIGLFPDVGASKFLSKLPGSFGEYLALTGTRLDGGEMLACGLASHFVLSKENEVENDGEKKWIKDAIRSMRSASPTSLKITLKSWDPPKLESITDEMVGKFFTGLAGIDPHWVDLQLPIRSGRTMARARL